MSIKICQICKQTKDIEDFLRSNSILDYDGYSSACGDCIENLLSLRDYDWAKVDDVCRAINIPFIPSHFEKIRQSCKNNPFRKYALTFSQKEYEKLNWEKYYKTYKELEERQELERELPLFDEKRRQELLNKWGHNYDNEDLEYLENLYNGLYATQSISGALQVDQALKICKISLLLDQKIRAGEDFDKVIASYDKLVKTAEFTPKNTKNAGEFESVGELFKWLEKRGWKNQYYTDVPKDVVDETIKNIQAYNQRLYTNETGIGEEITRRIEALKNAEKAGDDFSNPVEMTPEELEDYNNAAFDKLIDGDDFEAEV